LIELIKKNVRVPVLVMGDLNAQISACRLCENGLTKLVQRYGGADIFEAYIEALHDYAERMMREEIAGFPDGVYEFEDYIDGFGEIPEPIRFKVAVTIAGDSVTVDWTGTSKQVKAAINGPIATTYSMTYAAMRCLVRTPMPNCQGFIRPINMTAPPGSIVNPTEPAACASRGIIAYRLQDTLYGAISQFAPERMPAACEGGPTALSFGGRDGDEPFVALDPFMGTWGGRHDRDGALSIAHWNCQNMSVEFAESRMPVEVSCYAFAENSGGPGRYRGGYSSKKAYRILTDEVNLNIRSDRRANLPYGLNGGLPGTPSWNIVNPGPKQRLLPTCPMGGTVLNKDDVFFHVQPGGGGMAIRWSVTRRKCLTMCSTSLLPSTMPSMFTAWLFATITLTPTRPQRSEPNWRQ
jgi:N-methylhydantoinase B